MTDAAPAPLTYAVEYAYDASPEELAAVRPEHRAFLRALCDAGDLLASGPLPEDGGALLLVRAASDVAARDLLAADPFQVAGVVGSTTVRRWDPVIGPWA
ncbi:hypothetical protein EDD28_2874 [Salana multivorans]|uniref:YCII-related domain-containing protein n=1 Tax=Salana multivorans TaxID=120377 RepID=A0A3N2D106_9MICO|nr:YciI family protein [Salana multivorans]ROR93460.1 hypothetical protein EDD28_2874 [Salana multivorans]